MAYLIALSIGAGGVWAHTSYSKCDSDYGNTFQSYVAIDIYIFTSLRFATAKAIDVTIDLVLGQGGRVLHGWFA